MHMHHRQLHIRIWLEQILVTVVQAIKRPEEFNSSSGKVHDEMVDCLGDGEGCRRWKGGSSGGGTGERFRWDRDGVVVGGGEF